MDKLEKQKFVFGTLFLLANKLQAIGDHHLGDSITMKQWFLIMMASQLGDNPPKLTEVAELMGSSRQNVKQLALKLEEKEFLRLEKDPQDARAIRLIVTDKFQAFWKTREKQDDEFLENLFEEFSGEEMAVLAAGFGKLLKKVGKIENSGIVLREAAT